jgi:putative oxidoreductase
MAEAHATTGRDRLLAVVCLLCRLAVGGTLVYAAIDKVLRPADFAQAVYNYHLVPMPLLHPFALVMPWLEVVAGGALVLGVARRGAGLLAAILTAIFIVALGSALARGLDISCGCFHTTGGHHVAASLLWRDAVMLAACMVPLVWARRDRIALGVAVARRSSGGSRVPV